MTVDGTSAPTRIESFKAVPRSSEATVEIRLRDRSRSRDGEVPRLLPGDVLVGRYRLLSFLGRGGMGEIYQVEDLKLGQTVALKFLPEAVVRKGAALARFHQEVRLARQVSHPNVCRVFDVGEAHGRPFLCMEFIRGNDLRSLLREGQLPLTKALNIAWQLCAGLSAIHDAGILHRDLKPSNVMIDERGRARITDFGVAAPAEESLHEWSGTPAYMSPEQAVNGEMSIRSDLYSLGLVLYELFAGRKAFEEEPRPADHKLERHGPMPLSNLVADLDPTAERMIFRCLEKDPRNRPSSAAEVARAFSVDPLATALASGITPSPEMVASIQEVGDLSPAKGATWLATVLLLLLMLPLLSDRFMAHRQISLPYSPQVLARRVHSLLAQLGYKENLRYITYGFEPGKPGQPLYKFWYRESLQRLQPESEWEDPSRIAPGEKYVELDMEGRLWRLEILPEVKVTRGHSSPDWTMLLRATGFDPAQLKPVRPSLASAPYVEQRVAWEASISGNPPRLMRIEAASFDDRPVSLNIETARTASFVTVVTTNWMSNVPFFIGLPFLLGTIAMARRHLRLGIGDLNGAWRLASIQFFLHLIQFFFFLIQWPSSGAIPTWNNFLHVVGFSAFAWCGYLSIEPLLRRSWHAKIVSWTRLMAGHIRNPMVGRDILAGCVLGLATCVVGAMEALIASSFGQEPQFQRVDLNSLLGISAVIQQLCADLGVALTSSLAFSLFLLLSYLILRRERWAIAAVAMFSLSIIVSSSSYNLWLAIIGGLAKVGLFAVIWLRFGLLADLTSRIVYSLVLSYPLTDNPSDWYAGTTLFVLLVVSGLALYGFVASTAPSWSKSTTQPCHEPPRNGGS